MSIIYFDYNATTPLDAEVREAMLPFLDSNFGNPSSVHQVGRKARSRLDESRERCAAVLKCKPSEILFTSGGTESNNLALFGAARSLKRKGKGSHIISTAVEHHAVLHPLKYLEENEGFSVTLLPVDANGVVALESVQSAIRPETILVSIMSANNEVGSIQPAAEIGKLCRSRGVLFHTDAAQSFGKEPFASISQFEADLVSICAHKLHGPKGAGALYVRSPLLLDPLILGGPHENERRAGTENLAGIVGMTEALERFVHPPVFQAERLNPLVQRISALAEKIPGVHLACSSGKRLVNTVSLLVEKTDSIALLAGLDMEGICASSGSACGAGSLVPSHVVRAMGFDEQLSRSLLRFSLGRASTEAEVSHLETVLPEIILRAQRFN